MSDKEVLGTWRQYTNSRVQTEQIEEKEMRERREVDLGRGGRGFIIGEGMEDSSVNGSYALYCVTTTVGDVYKRHPLVDGFQVATYLPI